MTNDTSDLIADLVTKWEDSFEIGLNLTPKEVCFEHPDLEQIVSEQITKLKRMRWLTSTWDSHASETLSNGTVIANRFHIEGVLGSGGFGTVYRAMDAELLRSVALKIANPNRKDPDTLLTEARNAASLHHPYVVTVYDVGRFEERVFIVSQLVEGRSLKDVAYGSKPTAIQIANWMKQVAEALEVAHKNGLVHRDLKPSNIIINKDQQAMVSDFGIAFHANEIDQIEPLAGTLPYMSPEQVQGESKLMGPKSDVFSFGVMLYELLAGKHPFLSKSSPETIRKITTAKPEPLTDVPVQLKMLCEQCLSVRPKDRPSAAQVVTMLKEFLEAGQRSSIFPAFIPLLVGSMFAVGLGGVAWWPLLPDRANKDSVSQASTEANNPKAGVPESPTIADQLVPERAKHTSTPEPTNPNVVNLLQMIHLPSHVISGTWGKDAGVLKVNGLTSPAGGVIQIPYQPKGPYTLTIRARRQRFGGIIVPVVYAGRQFGVFLAAGYDESKIPNTVPEVKVKANFFPSKDWHTVTIEVDGSGVRCEGDTGAVLDWNQGYGTVQGRPYDVPDATGLYLKIYEQFEIDKLEIKEPGR